MCISMGDKYNSSLEDATKLKFAALQIPFPMQSFLAKVKFFIFRPKTMDYNYIVHGLIFGSPKTFCRNGCHWKEHLKGSRMAQI